MKQKIIAEIASAHQGKEEFLKLLVNAVAEAGADAIKFQWYKYNHLATKDYPAYSIYKRLFMNEEVWEQALYLAKEKGLEVWIDVYDKWAIEMLRRYNALIDGLKLPPAVLQAESLINEVVGFAKPLMIGVGGWYEEEIDELLVKTLKTFTKRIILLLGYQGFPTKAEDASLRRIQHFKNKYGLEVGYADHVDGASSLASEIPLYAYFAGAEIIEKHIIMHRSKEYLDYFSALEPHEFSYMVKKLRAAQALMGDIKITENERKYLKASLKAVAGENIKCGDIVTLQKTEFKRCNTELALNPVEVKRSFPLIAVKDINKDEALISQSLDNPVVSLLVFCRLKSTRLPRKALLPIYGIASIERCLINCLEVKEVDDVVLATSYLSEDEPLKHFTMDDRVKILRDDPDNLVDRSIKAVALTGANIIIKVTGDCPCVSPEIIKILLKEHLEKGADFTYANNSPLGLGANIITVNALKSLLNYPEALTHTEYLIYYFINNPQMFRINEVKLPPKYAYPSWRLTLDEPKDLQMLEEIYQGLDIGRKPLYFSTLHGFLEKNPKILEINKDITVKYLHKSKLIKEIKKATTLG